MCKNLLWLAVLLLVFGFAKAIGWMLIAAPIAGALALLAFIVTGGRFDFKR